MQTVQSSVLWGRDDTVLGVCEALGEDFRFHPNILRVAFAVLLYFNPIAAIGGYLGAGVIVAVSRWFVPNPKVAADDAAASPAGTDEQVEQAQAWEELAVAA